MGKGVGLERKCSFCVAIIENGDVHSNLRVKVGVSVTFS